MLELSHTSLPIEYQLKYGTACGNLDFSQLVCEAPGDSLGGIYGGLTEKKSFGVIWVNSSPVSVDSFDSLLVRLNGR